jgi:hypothetical protein
VKLAGIKRWEFNELHGADQVHDDMLIWHGNMLTRSDEMLIWYLKMPIRNLA